jgi:hypothetical protein
MPIKIKSTSGSVTLDAQNVSGDQTLTVPSLSGGKTLLTTDGDGSSLTGVSQAHTSSGTAPSSPAIGDKWHDTTNEKLYMRTNDGTSDLWLQI